MKRMKMNQKGQGMLEYIILTGLIGIFCLATFKSLGKSMKTRVKNINSKITEELTIN
jgi:Flp pilus assembly pilin Flp